MKKKLFRTKVFPFLLTLFLLSFICVISPSKAQDSFILNYLSVNPQENTTDIHLVVLAPQADAVEEALKKGLILKFNINFDIYEKRTFLTDKKISEKNIEYFLRYDPLTRQYMAIFNTQPPLRNANCAKLLQSLTKNIHTTIPVTYKKETEYALLISLEIEQHQHETWMKKNLFFVEQEIFPHFELEYLYYYLK